MGFSTLGEYGTYYLGYPKRTIILTTTHIGLGLGDKVWCSGFNVFFGLQNLIVVE